MTRFTTATLFTTLCVSFRTVPKVTVISEALRKAPSCGSFDDFEVRIKIIKCTMRNAHLTVLQIVEAAPGTNRHQLAQAAGRNRYASCDTALRCMSCTMVIYG